MIFKYFEDEEPMVVSSFDGQKRLEVAFDLGYDTAEAYALAAKIIYHIEKGAVA